MEETVFKVIDLGLPWEHAKRTTVLVGTPNGLNMVKLMKRQGKLHKATGTDELSAGEQISRVTASCNVEN